MNVLIADSGSTKTEWAYIPKTGEVLYFKSKGMNPYFCSQEQMVTEICSFKDEFAFKDVEQIFFYGAGCSAPDMQDIIAKALRYFFKDADLSVNTDLLGAARAIFYLQEGIACILGTGSNSGVYDGNEIIQQLPSLGFILGDEGSGSYYGKQILHDYYYNRLPSILRRHMEEQFDMNLHTTMERIYRHERGNAYAAGFTGLMTQFPEHEYVKKLLSTGLSEFISMHLNYYKGTSTNKVGMVGSLAFLFQEQIKTILEKNGYELEKIIRHPLDELVNYHTKHQ